MTNGSLQCDIPTLEPDDDLVDRLAGLAAASRPSRGGVVVPVAFGGPAARAVAVAAAVAAITAGGAAAATQLAHRATPEPAPPITSVGTPSPDDSGRHHEHSGPAAPPVVDTADVPKDHQPGEVTQQPPAVSPPRADDHSDPGPRADDSPEPDPTTGPGRRPSPRSSRSGRRGRRLRPLGSRLGRRLRRPGGSDSSGPGGGSDDGSDGGSDGPGGSGSSGDSDGSHSGSGDDGAGD